MAKRRTGLNPLAYMGVESLQPPSMYQYPSSPTANDVMNFNLGDFWINTVTETLYVLVSQQNHVAAWVTTFGGATSQFVTNSGTATDSGGVINLVGDGVNTNVSATGNTISVNLDPSLTLDNLKLTGVGIEGVVQTDASGNLFATNGANGQILIGGGTNPAWTNLTAGSNITITNGPNEIVIAASGSGGGGAVTFVTDEDSPSSESGGSIALVGGYNIVTVGTGGVGDTVTFDLTGTTNHAVQVGNSNGSLTSLSVGTNGQVLVGSTGANPVFATLTSSDGSVTFTPGAGSLSIQAVGGGGGGSRTIVTPFATAGGPYTWTKNTNTQYVEVWGWCGGGGGGSGGSNQGGAGGGSGSFFRFKGPATSFGATEMVVVGAGGSGGAPSVGGSFGNDGTNGTVSSFGNIKVPLCVNGFTTNSTLTSLDQFGAGGGNPSQRAVTCGYSGGVFTDDGSLIYSTVGINYQYNVPTASLSGVAQVNGGGAGSFEIGANGLSIGGLAPYGLPSRGSFGFVYMLGTSGAQGGSISTSLNYYNGGVGGQVYGFDTTTVLSAGGTAGIAGGSTAGGNGNNMPTSGGLVMGGTGGGGGAADPNQGGAGGAGGIPGGGGGGGGTASSGRPTGAGGNGGKGLVIVIEWT